MRVARCVGELVVVDTVLFNDCALSIQHFIPADGHGTSSSTS